MINFKKALLSLPILVSTVACSSSGFSVKDTNGYTHTYEKENITVTTKQENRSGTLQGKPFESKGKVTYYYVQANGVVETLDGKTHHHSTEAVRCKIDSYTTVEIEYKYKVNETVRGTRYINGKAYENVIVANNQNIGWYSKDEIDEMNSQYDITGRSYNYNLAAGRRFVVEGSEHNWRGGLLNEDNITCQAAVHFGLISE